MRLSCAFSSGCDFGGCFVKMKLICAIIILIIMRVDRVGDLKKK